MYLLNGCQPYGGEIVSKWNEQLLRNITLLPMVLTCPMERLGTMTLIIRATGGCDMSCTPIDSGVLFLLIGGGLFGGFMIKRRRETELMPLAAK